MLGRSPLPTPGPCFNAEPQQRRARGWRSCPAPSAGAGVGAGAGPLTCLRRMLEVVSDEVLPSERLKRLLRFGSLRGLCGESKR